MKKPLFLATVFLLAVSLGSAEITPKNPANITLDPSNEATQEFDIDLQDNDTEVKVAATSTGDYDVSYKSFRRFDEDGTFSANIEAPDKGNYSQNVTFSFEVEREGNLSDQLVLRDVESYTRIPYTTLQEPTWINQSYRLNVNGKQLNVSDIETNLYFNNNSLQLSGTKTINDVRLHLEDVIPGQYAKISADTKAEDATLSLKQIEQAKEPEPKTCKLGIKTITTLQRGNSFAIETVDTNSDDNKIVGGISVTLIDSGKGEPIGNTESGSSGYSSIYIPEDTKGPVVARLTGGDCESNNQRVSFNKPYNVYIEDNEEFQLNLQLDNTTFYGDITGLVRSVDGGKVGSGIIKITKPNGQKTDVAFNSTGFSYSPSEAGDYKFRATKDGYVKTDRQTVTYIADRDGDGVPNSEDDCPDTEGVEANNGCPKKQVRFEVYKDGERYVENLRPKQEYTIRLVDQNNSVVDFNGQLPVEGSETTLQFEDGVAKQGDSNTVIFKSTGSYGLDINQSSYEPATQNFNVKKKPFLEGAPVMPIMLGLLLLGGIGFVAYAVSASDSNSGSQPQSQYSYDLNTLGEEDQ